jgi:hypothetical protein
MVIKRNLKIVKIQYIVMYTTWHPRVLVYNDTCTVKKYDSKSYKIITIQYCHLWNANFHLFLNSTLFFIIP